MSHEYTYDISMFRDTFETRFTYLNGFLRNVSRFGSRPALFDPHSGRRWTYRELNAEANRLAHALRADGVGKNDVVMFTLLNSPEFVFRYLAAHKIGAIACPVNYRQGAGEIALVIDDSTPKDFIYDAEFGELSGGALDLCESKLPSRSLSARTMPYLPVRCAIRITLPISRKMTRRSTSTRISMTRPPVCTLPAQPTVRRACRSTISTRCFPRMTL